MVRRPPISTCVLALSIAFAATASAQQRPADDHRVLPDFDSRTGQRAAVTPDSGVRTSLDQLRTTLGPSLRARFDRSTGYVSRLTAGRRGIGAYRANAPRAVAQQFLREYGGLIGLEPADLVTLVVAREYRSIDEPVTHVQYRQLVAGVPVFGAALHLNVDADGSVIAVSSDGIVGRTTGRNRPAGGLSAEFAIQAAAANVRPELSISPVRRTGPTGPAQTLTYAAGPFQRDIEVEQALFPVERTLRPAWVVTIEPVGFPQTYTIVVDGETGEILYRRNLQLYVDGYGLVLQSDATAAVDPRLPDRHPAGSTPSGAGDPADGCPPVANYAVRGLTGPFLDSGSVLFGSELAGNNVDVSLNVEGTRGAVGQEIDGDWVFAYPFNSSSSAETSLFFASNFAHDFFYALGFDEAAGNFQVDNFSRGGAGGDPLSVVARASGRNNATFRPAPDGSSPTMSLFLWDGQGCWAEDVDGDSTSDVDSAYDADIFLHEFHHGVSHRLNPSFTGAEADAIGEGGSDFFAYSVFGDTRLAEYAFPPSGIRQVNGKTYADWLCLFGFFCEEHLNGEIWANVLWDIRERFRSDQVNGSEGAAVNEIHRLYVDGLKLSPPAPTMLDLRDTMILADQTRNPSADPGGSVSHCRLWHGFATRGMGANALDTRDTGTNTVMADFSLPAVCGGGAAVSTVTVVASGAASETGETPATITIQLDEAASRDLTVGYTVSGTATAGADYQTLSGQVSVAEGATTAAVVIQPIDDTLVENDETVVVTLAGGSG